MTPVNVILIAEDNDDDRFFFSRALRRANIGSNVQVVSDGAEAIAYLDGEGKFSDRVRYPYPEVVFLDIKMPYKTGYAVLEWIREHGKKSTMTVCVLSTSPQAEDSQRCRELGADFYATKPAGPDLFEQLTTQGGLQWAKAS